MRYLWTISGSRPLNILQSTGNGCAFLDYNNDGYLDILLVGSKLALFQGDGAGRFHDVSHQTGLDRLRGHFLGCAVGDYDNDSFEDLYISGYRTGLLLRNLSGRRFQDVTRSAGLAPQAWGSSAQFYDFNGDGKLDLYVGGYVRFGLQTEPKLCNYQGVLSGCGPTSYSPVRGSLYLNEGGGRFRLASSQYGLDKIPGRTLGVAAAPATGTASTQLAIADDETPASLTLIRGKSGRDIGAEAGIATAGSQVYGGMGVDWGDYDNDGRLDLVVATYQNQGKLLFRNRGGSFVPEDSNGMGLASSLPYVAFGVKWLDYDNDGWLDLIMANGHVQDNADSIPAFGNPIGQVYRQPTVLYHNSAGKRFEDCSGGLGGLAGRPIVGRGLAIGDYANNGGEDALVVDAEGSPLLLHNATPHRGHWLELSLRGRTSNRDGIGALVSVRTPGLRQTRLCTTGGSYLSASDRRVHVGLGRATSAEVEVRWPSGRLQRYGVLRADRIISLDEIGGSQLVGQDAAE